MKHSKTKLLSTVISTILGITSAATFAAENLIQNGGFEAFTTVKEKTNWKQVNLDAWSGTTKVRSSMAGKNASEGSAMVLLDSDDTVNSLEQSITTLKGADYNLTFDAFVPKKILDSADIEVLIDGDIIETITPTKDWISYTVNFVGKGTSQTLIFREVASQNSKKGAVLDNIILTTSNTNQDNTTTELPATNTLGINLAQRYGAARQGARSINVPAAQLAIDGDMTTTSESCGGRYINWWTVDLPKNIQVSNVNIHAKEKTKKDINNAKVYLTSEEYISNKPLKESELIATLTNNENQEISIPSGMAGSHLVIKYDRAKCVKLNEVEVYGDFQEALVADPMTVTIDHWQNKVESILKIATSNNLGDTPSYSIEGNFPFTINASGELRVNNLLNKSNYQFNVVSSDGVLNIKTPITVTVSDQAITKQTIKSNDRQPQLTGYLPNTYQDSDNVLVIIDGIAYSAIVNGDGTWSLDKGSIQTPLTVGKHDITLVVGDQEIVYNNYFEVYSTQLHKVQQNLIMPIIEDINVEVLQSVVTLAAENEVVRGTDVHLIADDEETRLDNKSYRKIKSLLGRYTNDAGEKVLVRLIFTAPIEAYSNTTLQPFLHDQDIEIVPTANLFNIETAFSGQDCSNVVDTKVFYCVPTDEQKAFYAVYLNGMNHLYNSTYGINLMQAWVENRAYKAVDLSTYGGKATAYEQEGVDLHEQFYNYLYRAVMPNQRTDLKTIYGEAHTGKGNNYRTAGTTIGDRAGWGWGSIWNGNFGLNSAFPYDIVHHEMMHGAGFGHGEGMSYGWSTVISKAINAAYGTAATPVAEVPNYVFSANRLDDNRVQITVYQTNDASKEDVTIEILSSKKLTSEEAYVEKSANDAANQLTFITKDRREARHLFRIYGEDSEEVMTLIFVPEGVANGQ